MEDFVIRATTIKRSVYLVPIIILAALLVLQYYYPHCSACDGCGTNSSPTITAAVAEIETVEEVVNETVETEVNTTNSTEVNTTEVNTTETNTTVEEELLPITGSIKLTIDKITYDNKGTWAKITKIKYTIVNQKEDLTPKILVYGYDESYNSMDMGFIEEEIVLPELKAGASITKESIVSITFNDLDVEKTIKLELTRDGGTTVLKTAIKKIQIE